MNTSMLASVVEHRQPPGTWHPLNKSTYPACSDPRPTAPRTRPPTTDSPHSSAGASDTTTIVDAEGEYSTDSDARRLVHLHGEAFHVPQARTKNPWLRVKRLGAQREERRDAGSARSMVRDSV